MLIGLKRLFGNRKMRVGGRGSKITDRRNWDAYRVNGKIVQLGPKEGLKMQGFPDWFEFPPTLSSVQAMKQLGNSVAVPAIQAVAEDFGLPGEATRESSGSLGQEAQPSGEPTPQQLECFKRKLGDARFNEIMRSGGEPTAGDLAKARDCF